MLSVRPSVYLSLSLLPYLLSVSPYVPFVSTCAFVNLCTTCLRETALLVLTRPGPGEGGGWVGFGVTAS